MTDHQRAWFYAEYEAARKDEVVGVVLALLLGSFGLHKFYMRENTAGVLYLLFSWTGIPGIIGFVECFFMPGRIRAYNAAQASHIASEILASSPGSAAAGATPAFVSAGGIGTTQPCRTCGVPVEPAAAFCPHCGTARVV
jgi:TM2 domain-containing membrane protein YozV